MLNKLDLKVVNWHYRKNLIDGATDRSQTEKLLEEFMELVAAQMVGHSAENIAIQVNIVVNKLLKKDRIKPVSKEDAPTAKLDAIGDMMVVMINIAERNGSSIEDCLSMAWKEIEHRKGRMIDGCFVKEADLLNT